MGAGTKAEPGFCTAVKFGASDGSPESAELHRGQIDAHGPGGGGRGRGAEPSPMAALCLLPGWPAPARAAQASNPGLGGGSSAGKIAGCSRAGRRLWFDTTVCFSPRVALGPVSRELVGGWPGRRPETRELSPKDTLWDQSARQNDRLAARTGCRRPFWIQVPQA